MTSKEVMNRKPKPGYWFENTAPLGSKPDWQEVPKPYEPDEGKLFGYDEKEFLAKQYK